MLTIRTLIMSTAEYALIADESAYQPGSLSQLNPTVAVPLARRRVSRLRCSDISLRQVWNDRLTVQGMPPNEIVIHGALGCHIRYSTGLMHIEMCRGTQDTVS